MSDRDIILQWSVAFGYAGRIPELMQEYVAPYG